MKEQTSQSIASQLTSHIFVYLLCIGFTFFATTPALALSGSSKTSVKNIKKNKQKKKRKKKSKNAIAIEFLGRGLLYSVSYDRMLGRNVSLGAGYAYANFNMDLAASSSIEVMVIPIYSNIYFLTRRHRPFVTAGINITQFTAISELETKAVTNSKGLGDAIPIDLKAGVSITVPAPHIGGGYEYRNPNGILARLTLYGHAYGTFIPWLGIGVGANF